LDLGKNPDFGRFFREAVPKFGNKKAIRHQADRLFFGKDI
jgi:hypothetical protein